MSKSMKAALLSAFVFPGAGHFSLKKPIVGTVLAGAAFASLYSVLSNTFARALQISAEIQGGEVPLDVAAITELVTKQPTGTELQLLNIAAAVFSIAWLIGIVDSYRVGHGQDKADADRITEKEQLH